MFNFFKKKQKTIKTIKNDDTLHIDFTDILSQNISIFTKRDGKDNLLIITENKSNTKIILDHEQSIILYTILNDFITNHSLINFYNFLNNVKE